MISNRNDIQWKVSAAPASEPVTLAEAKLHLRVDISDDDDLITSLIKVARIWSEGYQNRAYVNQSITLKMNKFQNRLELPRSPLGSVTSVKYLDTEGSEQTLSSSFYDVDTTSEPGLVTLAYGQNWPAIRDVHHAIEVIFVAGYGATAANVPETVKAAIKLIVGHLYEHREDVSEITLNEVPMAAKSLLAIDRAFL